MKDKTIASIKEYVEKLDGLPSKSDEIDMEKMKKFIQKFDADADRILDELLKAEDIEASYEEFVQETTLKFRIMNLITAVSCGAKIAQDIAHAYAGMADIESEIYGRPVKEKPVEAAFVPPNIL